MSLDRKRPHYIMLDGFRVPACYRPDYFRQAVEYKPTSDDLFIATYPKCGTTWMQQILFSLFHQGQLSQNVMDVHPLVNFLEMLGVADMKRPGVIKTHLPFHLAPYSPEAKYIYIARNPKDCCVSFYNHTKTLPMYKFDDGTFDEFFEMFIRGETDYMDYFDHLLGWYMQRHHPNVLFLTYEGMKADIEGTIVKLAKFIGPQYEELIKDQDVLANVILNSSFGHMKNKINQTRAKLHVAPADQIVNDPHMPDMLKQIILNGQASGKGLESCNFIRKGEVGDWRNYFSEDQNRRMNEWIAEKTKGSDVMMLWQGVDCL